MEKSGPTRIDTAAIARDFERRLTYSLAKDRYSATPYDHFLALTYAVRDQIVKRWIQTQQTYHRRNVKRVY